MNVRHTVRVGQVWESNDVRNPRQIEVIDIIGYEHGEHRTESKVETADTVVLEDRVKVQNVSDNTGRITVIRRKNFCTGTRGWTLVKEAPDAH